MGMVEGRGRAVLALGLFSYQMHPLSTSGPSQGHLGSRSRTLLHEESNLVDLKRETRVPVTHLLVFSNTLLHHLGAKRLLLAFFFFSLKGWKGNIKADFKQSKANYRGGFCDVGLAR